MDSYDGKDSDLQQEIEVLQEIYINELEVDRDSRGHICWISLQLHPATGDQVDQKWVCLTLVLKPSPLYPDEVPQIHIKNPRGLSEEYVIRLQNSLSKLAEDKRGECMLFELIELAKDSLTQGNLPHGECVICKEGFSEKEHFTKTQCYHYFHCHCLLRYIKYSEQEIEEEYEAAVRISPHVKVEKKKVVCPVCREPLTYDLAQLQKHPEQDDLDLGSITISKEVRQIQKQMAALFKKQQSKGGIIDLQAEKDKYLVPSSLSASLGMMMNGCTGFTDDCSNQKTEGKPTDMISFNGENGNYMAEGWNTGSSTKPNEDPDSGELLQKIADEKTSKPVNVCNPLSKISLNSVASNTYKDRTRYTSRNNERQAAFRHRNSNRSRPRGQGHRNYDDSYDRRGFGDKKTGNKSKQVVSKCNDMRIDKDVHKGDDETGDLVRCDEVGDELDTCFTDKRDICTVNRYPNDAKHQPVSQRKKVYHERWRAQRSYHGSKNTDHIDTEGDVGERCDASSSDVAFVSSDVRTNDGGMHIGTEHACDRRYGVSARGGYGRSQKRNQQYEKAESGEYYTAKDKYGALRSSSEIEYSETTIQSNPENSEQHNIQSKDLPASSGLSECNQMCASRSERGYRNRFRQQRPNNRQTDGGVEGEDVRGQSGYNESTNGRNQTRSHRQQKQHHSREEKDQLPMDSSCHSNGHHKQSYVNSNRTVSRGQYRSDGSHGHQQHHHHRGGYRKHEQKHNGQSKPADDKSFDSKDAIS